MSSEAVGPWRVAHKRQRDIDALLRSKHARPIESEDDLLIEGVFPSDDEVDEFNRAVREWRDASLA